jgi:ribosomal protein S18 acetylase RimI-like enzyme
MIRPATENDAAPIARVHVASWRSTYAGVVPGEYLDSLDVTARTMAWTEQIAAQQAIFSVAECDGEVCGFICGGGIREAIPGYDAELYAIYLLKGFQGQGIGRALTGAVVHALRASGFRGMAVWVLEQNPAVEFYRRLGAIPIAKKKITIGGVELDEIALGWPNLAASFAPDAHP